MAENMKAVLVQHGRLRLAEMPRPTPGPYQCLTRTLFGATCNATDRGFIERSAEQPLVLGHETVGRVIQAGVKVRNVSEGDMVLRPVAVYPGEELAGIRAGIGGFSEYGLVTDLAAAQQDGVALPGGVAAYSRFQQKVPADISPRDATMMITFKETLSWSQRAGVGPGKGVLVIGDGPVGQSFVKMASLLGANPVVIVGHWPQRLDRALALGATRALNRRAKPLAEACAERVANIVIDAVGSYDLITEVCPLMREQALYTVYGMTKTRQVAYDMSRSPREWTLRFMKMDEAETHDQVIAWMRSGKLVAGEFYDLALPMDRVQEAFDRLAARQANKIVLEM